jgi:hypothetical protein
LVEERLSAHHKDPASAVPLETMKARLRSQSPSSMKYWKRNM